MAFASARAYMLLSVAAAVSTIVLKTAAWRLTGSVGLLSDAMESVVNLVAALGAIWALTLAAKPADRSHNYGHFKAEYFSSALESVLIVLAALAIIYAAVGRLLQPEPLEQLGIGSGSLPIGHRPQWPGGLDPAARLPPFPLDHSAGRRAPSAH